MTELRRDPIVGRWVIINTDNPQGPDSFEKEAHSNRHAATCVFCPGKEKQTPLEIEAFRKADSKPNTPGWTVRVVPNKFPALKIDGELGKAGAGIYDMSNGIGAHEVLIETPEHKKSLAEFSEEEMLNVIKMYKRRAMSLAEDKRFKYILIFKNFGQSAGASQEHEHSQIIALPMVPKYVLEELEGAEYYYEYRGRCVFCDMIYQENQDKERIVAANEDFLCFCPFAPRYPFECWIMPKEHSAQFCEITEGQERHLAALLREMIYRIKGALSDPSYNFFLHVAPVHYENEQSFHWHIEIVPKLTRVAGFEWGTGFYVVPTSPSEAAKYLREVK